MLMPILKNNKEELIDGVDFYNHFIENSDFFSSNEISKNKLYIFLKQRIFWPIRLRFLGFVAHSDRKLSFMDVLRLFLPTRLRPERLDVILSEYIHSTEKEAAFYKNAGLFKVGAVGLFGNRFIPAKEQTLVASWRAIFLMIKQIVIFDEYNTKGNLKNNSVVIDAGANIGIFSVMAANICPEGKVYAFEPAPSTFDILRQNVAPYKNVQAYCSALGMRFGEGDLRITRSSFSNGMVDSEMNVGRVINVTKVPVETIDDFVEKNNLERVDFIKIDTEGYESKIIEGARKTIAKFSPAMAMSAYHHDGDKKDIPNLVLSINPQYKYNISGVAEEILLFKI